MNNRFNKINMKKKLFKPSKMKAFNNLILNLTQKILIIYRFDLALIQIEMLM